jgi:Family of unknown function (DUF5681)
MSENERDYEVGRGKPPVHTRFKKGQSGNPRGPRPKNLPALLVEALNEPMVVTIDGERREITKREVVAKQLVNKSTGADLRATKMLIDTPKDVEKKAGVAPPPELAPFTAADEEVMATFIARLRQAWEEELQRQPRRRAPATPEENNGSDIAGRAPHPNPLPASGERVGPAKREGEGRQAQVFGDFPGRGPENAGSSPER